MMTEARLSSTNIPRMTTASHEEDPYEPEDNCLLRIHVPFAGGHVVDPSKTNTDIGCQDVVLYE